MPVVFFIVVSFRIAGGGVCTRWKKSQQVCHTPRQRWEPGYWFLQLLDRVSPSQWAAIGVLGSLLFGLLTYLTNLYFKIKEDRRKAARGE
ncbi:lysis protein S [Escherichia coli 5.0588]|nr:lysis protein S [Escherichia coli 5.0588]